MSALIEDARRAVTQARAALAALKVIAGAPTILRRVDSAKAVAFLAALAPTGRCDLVLPLREGKNLVGLAAGDHGWPAHDRAMVEAMQWAVRCEGHSARIADAGSAQHSVLVPVVTSKIWTTGMPVLADLSSARGVFPLPLPQAQQPVLRDLAEHDIVVNCYRAFVFGWR